ncbi:glycosyl transferase [Catellatospora sp. IY07-71]|uniref:glycosyltransferase family 9 protein n=1 Tax=Catellatospora sp. IY07-71 TaxID=2728827 RepID=UPI001BB4DE39|nr:glycosyltransferase family 9 protein [Catellatospora sp. IY07-71]BCJ76365.1 glycosyl transferase [Catellatospora sp. IY07-71]
MTGPPADILVLRALGIGDLATGVPALRGLRAAYPAAALTLAAPAWLAPLVDLIGAVDRLDPVDGLRSRPGWGRYDLTVNLHGRGPQSHRLLAPLGVPLWAFRNPEAGCLIGPEWRPDEHEVARWCRLVAWYGAPADPADLRLSAPRAAPAEAGATLVHPGAKAPARRWPPERFAAVARALSGAGHRVLITGSAGDAALARHVAGLAGLPGSQAVAGRTDIGELAGLVAHARLVVCGDTGIGHLATAYGTPSVVLFAELGPHLWGPPAARPWHRALWRADLAGEPPAADTPHPALAALTAAEVVVAAGQAIGDRSHASHRLL